MPQGGWKELKSPDGGKKEVKYHQLNDEFVDEIKILDNGQEITIKYSIDGVILLRTKNTEIIIKPLGDFEDPYFSYSKYFESTPVDEIISDIKDYMLYVMKYALFLE